MCHPGATSRAGVPPDPELCSSCPFLHFQAGSGAVRVPPGRIAHVSRASGQLCCALGCCGTHLPVFVGSALSVKPKRSERIHLGFVCTGKMDTGTDQQLQVPWLWAKASREAWCCVWP